MSQDGLKDIQFIHEFHEKNLPLHMAKILPSLSSPRYTAADKASHLRDGDCIVGITFNGMSRAYPTWIMDNYHIVNDTFGEASLVVVH